MRLAIAAALSLLIALPAQAQDAPVPDRRVVTQTGQDFYGGDIGSIFETTFRDCHRACLGNPDCKALTFNSRAGACFLKSGVERIEPFDGAISARMVETTPEVKLRAAARARDLEFLTESDLDRARTLAARLGGRIAANGEDLQSMRQAGFAAEASDRMEAAAQNFAAAVTVSDHSDDWRDLARVWANWQGGNSSERRTRRREALLASINAYLRAENPAAQATTLLQMAGRLEALNRGRDMIPALRLAQSLAPRREIDDRLDYALRNYGFRVVSHNVDADPVTARMCVEFSEELAEAGVDYGPYVKVQGADRLPVEAKNRQLCIDGLEHGRRYSLQIREGLPSGGGETLRKSAQIEAYIRDRSPSVRFSGASYVLPKSANAAIPVVTVNLPEVDLAIHRIGERSILPAMQDRLMDRALNQLAEDKLAERTGEAIWTGKAEIRGEVNADTTTALPIGDAVQTFEPGIYVMTARIPGQTDRWDRVATQWFIVTDLALASMAGADGLHGFVRKLSSADAVAGAKVTLLARNNEVLGTAQTDAQGYVRFDPGLTRGTGGAAPAMMTVEQTGDFAFLDLSKPGFDLSDRGVEGRAAPGPVDVFATTERGVYRPGEVIHLTALARDGAASAIDALPLTLVVTRPDGVEYHRAVLNDQGAGGRAHSLRLGTGVPRGTWKLKLHTDPKAPPVTELAVLVEDFVPERIDLEVTAPEGMVQPDAPITATLAARYLYGAPGADLPVNGEVRLTAAEGLPGFPGFSFGLQEEEIGRISTSFGDITTDAAGNATFNLPIPSTDVITRPLLMTASVRVTDSSGRPVERSLSRPLAPGGLRLGIRKLFEGEAEEGGTARFEIVAVGPDGKQIGLDQVGWTLSRINYDWTWYEWDGRWEWEKSTSRERKANGTVALTADGRAVIETSVDWGEYELKIANLQGTYTAASVRFYAGWYGGGTAIDTPDFLEMGLDKDRYAIGETVKVRLKPRHAGKVLLSVVDNRLIDMQAIDVTQGETTVELPVTPEWGPGAYITATLIRPMDEAQKRNPQRAIGLAWATVDPADRKLDVTVTTPDQVAPRGPFDASVQVAGLQPGEQAYVTLAAVDLGILNLTGFKSPDPAGHYFGQRRLGVEMRDIYGKLIDGLNGTRGRLRSGGDAEARRQTSAPPTDDLVAYFSGVVRVGPDGTATANFQVPDFNGTVRVMAVAWTDKAVGNAEKDVLVRDPIVVNAAIPRFLAPRDESRILLDVAHASGPAGEVQVTIESDGGIRTPRAGQSVNVAEGQIQQVTFPLTAVEIGNPELRVRTTTPDGRELLKNLTLPVRMNDPELTRQNRIPLPAGGRLVVNADTFAGLDIGSARATLGVGPVAQFDAPGLLQALDRYPYGCTEQTTSRALPLLYFDEMADALGMTRRQKVQDRIAAAIERILERQSFAGAFGLWRPGRGDLWLDAYVSDFLSRAKAKGYEVPKRAFDAAIDNLRSELSYMGDFNEGGEDVAYAMLVLAREGAASIGDLRYYADAKAEAFSTAMAKAQIGAALAMYGEQTRADKMFRLAEDQVLFDARSDELRGWRYDYGSDLRDGAAVLALAAEARSQAIAPQRIINAIMTREREWTSTQEKVWMLMATTALIDQTVEGLTINGAPVQGSLIRAFQADTIGQDQVVIQNTSGQATQAVLTTYGVPIQPEPAGGKGYRIERVYHTMDGTPVSPETVAQNDRLVVVLTIHSDEKRNARLIIDDPLPAGFEIDNPNLLRSGSIAALDWLDTVDEVQNAQFLSERFLAAVDHSGRSSFQLAYILRAVSPGLFHHPAALVEDMYRPDYRAWTATGQVRVVAATR